MEALYRLTQNWEQSKKKKNGTIRREEICVEHTTWQCEMRETLTRGKERCKEEVVSGRGEGTYFVIQFLPCGPIRGREHFPSGRIGTTHPRSVRGVLPTPDLHGAKKYTHPGFGFNSKPTGPHPASVDWSNSLLNNKWYRMKGIGRAGKF